MLRYDGRTPTRRWARDGTRYRNWAHCGERYRIRWDWTRSRNRYRAYRRDRHETWHRHRTQYRRCCWYQRPDGCQCWALTLGQARSTRRGSVEDQRWSSGTRRRVAGTAEHTQCNDEESDALHEATSSKRDTTWLARFSTSPQLLSHCPSDSQPGDAPLTAFEAPASRCRIRSS